MNVLLTLMTCSQVALNAAVVSAAPPPPDFTAASDWARTGPDCRLFAATDVDGDGYADVVALDGRNRLRAALTVEGWKASGWRTILSDLPNGAEALDADGPGRLRVVYADRTITWGDYDGETLREVDTSQRPSPASRTPIDDVVFTSAAPPFEPHAPLHARTRGDINGDDLADLILVYTATRPSNHLAVRVLLAVDPAADDHDDDGVPTAQEREIGSDPYDRDTDDDGLLDGWEVNDLPRTIAPPETALDPLHQDVLVAVAPYEGVDLDGIRKRIEKSKALYAALDVDNPDGEAGIRLHYRYDDPVPKDLHGHWHDVASKRFPQDERGVYHWMQVTGLGGGGQAQQLGDEGSAGANHAAFAHELGHQLGLSHTGDSKPVWCPLYPSIMNYAFNYSLGGDGGAIRFSDGRFASVELDESSLDEHLPFPYEELKYLSKGPFHFTLEPDEDRGTRIDWNHNGRFDEEPVAADINYGSSTNAGTRRKLGFIGAGPVLARIGGVIYLATLDQTQATVSLRRYQGDEEWSEPQAVAKSATSFDPAFIGGAESGVLLIRRPRGWWACRITNEGAGALRRLKQIPEIELSGGRVDGRVLLVGRHSDDTLQTWWLDEVATNDGSVSLDVSEGPELELTSETPVAFDVDPIAGQLVVATSMTNVKDKPLCLRVSRFERSGPALAHAGTEWVGGEKAGVASTTRPVLRFTEAGELYIFHTGTPRDDGQMIAYRTKRISNTNLRNGWLTTMLYDVWTRTRRPVAFEIAGDDAVYAFRWDAGDTRAYSINQLLVGHNGLGIDRAPMRDHDDAARMSLWGIRHSILYMRRMGD